MTVNEEVRLGKTFVSFSYVILRPVTVVCPHCGETVLTSVRSRSTKWYSLIPCLLCSVPICIVILIFCYLTVNSVPDSSTSGFILFVLFAVCATVIFRARRNMDTKKGLIGMRHVLEFTTVHYVTELSVKKGVMLLLKCTVTVIHRRTATSQRDCFDCYGRNYSA